MPAPSDLMPRRLGRQVGLDGIRGIAWVVVFCSHAFGLPLAIGQPCMFVFFALSGFLITGLLLQEHWQTGQISLTNFFARRGLRLLPALLFFLVGWLLIVLAAGGHAPWTSTVPGGLAATGTSIPVAFEGAGAALLYATNWADVWGWFTGYVPLGHLWSLAVEEQFYLVWAPAVALLAHCRRRAVTAVALVAALASFIDVAWREGGGLSLAIDMGTDTRSGAFLIGAVASVAWTNRARWVTVVQKSSGRYGVLGSLAILATSSWVMAHRVPQGLFILTWMAVSVAAAVLVVSLLGEEHRRRPLVGSTVATYVGRRSYGLYLWHYAWLTWLASFGFARIPLALGASLACAESSWRLVEKPALKQKRRFASAREPRPEVAAPVSIVVPLVPVVGEAVPA